MGLLSRFLPQLTTLEYKLTQVQRDVEVVERVLTDVRRALLRPPPPPVAVVMLQGDEISDAVDRFHMAKPKLVPVTYARTGAVNPRFLAEFQVMRPLGHVRILVLCDVTRVQVSSMHVGNDLVGSSDPLGPVGVYDGAVEPGRIVRVHLQALDP